MTKTAIKHVRVDELSFPQTSLKRSWNLGILSGGRGQDTINLPFIAPLKIAYHQEIEGIKIIIFVNILIISE
jgi:hypothetical protein